MTKKMKIGCDYCGEAKKVQGHQGGKKGQWHN